MNLLLAFMQSILQSQGQVLRKMRFMPSSLTSKSHRLLTALVDSRHKKVFKVKAVVTDKDPEKEKEDKERVCTLCLLHVNRDLLVLTQIGGRVYVFIVWTSSAKCIAFCMYKHLSTSIDKHCNFPFCSIIPLLQTYKHDFIMFCTNVVGWMYSCSQICVLRSVTSLQSQLLLYMIYYK